MTLRPLGYGNTFTFTLHNKQDNKLCQFKPFWVYQYDASNPVLIVQVLKLIATSKLCAASNPVFIGSFKLYAAPN